LIIIIKAVAKLSPTIINIIIIIAMNIVFDNHHRHTFSSRHVTDTSSFNGTGAHQRCSSRRGVRDEQQRDHRQQSRRYASPAMRDWKREIVCDRVCSVQHSNKTG